MGKGTDKLYITHSEWSSEDAYSASAGSNVGKQANAAAGASFRRLPFNFCALTLQPFKEAVCTPSGTIFDHESILEWLLKHPNKNPVDGSPLKVSDLIKLHFARNDANEYVDPVTYKVLTDNTHVVALRNTGNVFAFETIDRLNIKARNWRDLVSDAEFTRQDIIVLQDPQNPEARNLSQFQYIKEGTNTLTAAQEAVRASGVNASALGSSAKILKAKEAVAKARAERAAASTSAGQTKAVAKASATSTTSAANKPSSKIAYNTARHTTGLTAASFTSTGLTPHTAVDLATLSEEDWLLKPKRVKNPGYATLSTSLGELTLELLPEFAPKAVWNFIQLAKKGYYNGTVFHRNIRSFMIQGGDPTGTGRGGQSVWGKPFEDELDGPHTHTERGVLSMANKGKNTNGSQFFITYRPAKHLDRKHTVFGRVVGGTETLDRMERAEVGEKDRPAEDIVIQEVRVFVDPFVEFKKQLSEKERKEAEEEEIRRQGGRDDDRTTWTGKRIRQDGTVETESAGGVGKYLEQAKRELAVGEEEVLGEVGDEESYYQQAPPAKKKKATGGFGNFDSW